MPTIRENNKRIAKNTLMLYFRMFFMMIVSLYTVPVVLRALGVVDYGIYGVVGGVVALFSFLGNMLASGSQRFIAYALGIGNKQELKNTFDTTVTVYLMFAIIALALLESVGVWFLNSQMDIPIERLKAANWVLQCSILAFMINLISIPYNAAIIAHEKMSLYAYFSIFECLMKLVIAIALQYVLFDKLITYAGLICLMALILRILYQVSCRILFEECRKYRFHWDHRIGKQLLTYSGWNVVGSLAILFRHQGVNIVLNLFFGPILNAAHSIAQHINTILGQFINNVYTASRPQITKLYANNNETYMWKMVFSSARMANYLLLYLSIPVLVELQTILTMWLKSVPNYAVDISRLMIISMLIETLSNQIIAVFQAENRIRKYQLYSSTIILLNVPISYILLRIYNTQPILPYISSIILSVFYVVSLLIVAKKEINLDVFKYVKTVICRVFLIYALVLSVVLSVTRAFAPSILRVLITIVVSLVTSSIVIWLGGLEGNEKRFIVNLVKSKIYIK